MRIFWKLIERSSKEMRSMCKGEGHCLNILGNCVFGYEYWEMKGNQKQNGNAQ